MWRRSAWSSRSEAQSQTDSFRRDRGLGYERDRRGAAQFGLPGKRFRPCRQHGHRASDRSRGKGRAGPQRRQHRLSGCRGRVLGGDPMQTYQYDFSRLKQAFVGFLQNLPFYGSAILCVDDANVREIMPSVSKPIATYGTREDAMVRGTEIVPGDRMRFRALREGASPLEITLNLPGGHNVQNALAAIAVATELGIPDAAIRKALAEFRGVGRRFQRYGEIPPSPNGKSPGRFTLVDDYRHHPVEMQATLDAARGAFPGRRIVLAFQPHR